MERKPIRADPEEGGMMRLNDKPPARSPSYGQWEKERLAEVREKQRRGEPLTPEEEMDMKLREQGF